ncbi:MAG: CopG family transcriptional regulator [Gammaproteobacteria bacterium]|nr:CopG family transcriptional regulator [Gammaproteobacteria bacterium]
MKASEFDKKFDAGKNILSHLDLARARRPQREQQRVNVDFPKWMLHSLDNEADRLGVPRQSVIKIWIAERLDQKHIQ